jgi:hypothetical protein
VRCILSKVLVTLRPEGLLTFYEYWLGRRVLRGFAGEHQRERLRKVGRVLQDVVMRHGCCHSLVLWNLPPAVVHLLSASERAPS